MVEACKTSGKFSGEVKFTGQEGSNKGKMMSNCQTREALDWEPKYSSFEDFMAAGPMITTTAVPFIQLNQWASHTPLDILACDLDKHEVSIAIHVDKQSESMR